MIQLHKIKQTLLPCLVPLLLLTISCSTYKQNGKCYDYKPVGCFYGNARLVCEINSEGCETCNCVTNPVGKDRPLNRDTTQ